jgi:hypothetical protein
LVLSQLTAMDPFALLSAGVHYDKYKIPKASTQKTHTHSVALPLPGEWQQLTKAAAGQQPLLVNQSSIPLLRTKSQDYTYVRVLMLCA